VLRRGRLRIVNLGRDGRAALARANRDWGLALSDDENRLPARRVP